MTTKARATRPITVADQLAALRALCRYVGLLPAASLPADDPEDLLDQYGAGTAALAMVVIMDPRQGPYQKAACAALLDIFMPGWRVRATEEALSGVVIDRRDPAVWGWRKRVFARDGDQCVECGSGSDLHAHHIVRWVDAPHLRVVTSNGRTLCKPCHRQEHARAA